MLGHVCDSQGRVLYNILRLVDIKANDIPSLICFRADDDGSPPFVPLEKEEENWCSLYLCSRLLGLIVVILCKTKYNYGKVHFIKSWLEKEQTFANFVTNIQMTLHDHI